jgi:predicted ATPase
MAQACGALGQWQEGLAALREAIGLANHSGERWWEAEMYRIEGELTLQGGADNAAAEACFRHALERARAQGLRLFELRAATNLARLYQSQGRPAEARRALAPVLAAFTEGFGTRDLLDARAVLDRIPPERIAADGPP